MLLGSKQFFFKNQSRQVYIMDLTNLQKTDDKVIGKYAVGDV